MKLFCVSGTRVVPTITENYVNIQTCSKCLGNMIQDLMSFILPGGIRLSSHVL